MIIDSRTVKQTWIGGMNNVMIDDDLITLDTSFKVNGTPTSTKY